MEAYSQVRRRRRKSVFSRAVHRMAISSKIKMTRTLSLGANTKAADEVRNAFSASMLALINILRFLGRVFMWIFLSISQLIILLREPFLHVLDRTEAAVVAVKKHWRELNYVKNGARARIMPCAFLGCATLLILSGSYFGVAMEVKLDGKSLGYINSREEMEAIVVDVEQKASEYLGTPYNLAPNITYSLGYIDRNNMINTDSVRELLFAQISEVTTQYALTVDGQVVGATGSKTSLELLKQRVLKARAGIGENVKTEFVQDVKIEQRPVAQGMIKSVDEIEQALNGKKQGSRTYTVKAGDTISQIAQQNGISVTAVQSLNPGMDIGNVKIGTPVTLSAEVPMLSVKQTKKEGYTDVIAFDTVTESSTSLYKNQSRIVRNGVNGAAWVTANVVYIDGVEQSREVLSYDVKTQPVAQIKQIGTKAPPAKAPKGYFILPFRGIRTSLYGWRSRGFHTGLDLAGPTGSPIVAADGGTVTLARMNGGYGLCVIIDHGNGKQTLYGHCSKLLVKPGQKVAQGEQIAKVGNTGNSTGPHCHWEVRINGNTVNPANYLK